MMRSHWKILGGILGLCVVQGVAELTGERRWKLMAGLLGLCVVGLAACAESPNDKLHRPAATPDTTQPQPTDAAPGIKAPPAPSAPDTVAQAQPPAPEFPLPSLDPPKPAESPSLPAREIPFEIALPPGPVPELPNPTSVIVPDGGTVQIGGLKVLSEPERLPMPRMMEDNPMTVPAQAAPGANGFAEHPSTPRPVSLSTSPLPADSSAQPPAPDDGSPPLVPPPTLPPLGGTPALPMPATLPVSPSVYPAVARSNQPASNPEKLRMVMRLDSSTPRFEVRNVSGDDLLLKVSCEKIEMKGTAEQARDSHLAGVTAVGTVKFTGPGVQGTCDQLAILSGTGEVLLQGNVKLKTKRGKTWSELIADKMIYQLGHSGLGASSANGSGAKPASQ
jgi:hypothetical protein